MMTDEYTHDFMESVAMIVEHSKEIDDSDDLVLYVTSLIAGATIVAATTQGLSNNQAEMISISTLRYVRESIDERIARNKIPRG